jgi:DNA-binding response OmpR family regulator
MARVLLIDDDKEVLHINGEYLKGQGYQVDTAVSIKEALKCMKKVQPDCIVLDVMMPKVDGFDGFFSIRQKTQAPILFLTGRTEEEDRIRGLLLGADDYIVKPCSLKELSLRILINIRRQKKVEKKVGVLEFPPLRVELLNHKAFYNEEEILLSNREFEVLSLLVKHPKEILTFEQIGKELLGTYLESDRKNVMVAVSRLRKKLENYVGLENMVETVWGQGYCFKG